MARRGQHVQCRKDLECHYHSDSQDWTLLVPLYLLQYPSADRQPNSLFPREVPPQQMVYSHRIQLVSPPPPAWLYGEPKNS